MAAGQGAPIYVYVGTYTRPGGRAEGIYVYRMDPTSGDLTPAHTVPDVVNPSFLTLDPHHRYLYAVNEVPELDGQKTGAVSAFAVNQQSGGLTFLNRQASGGTGPCHLSVEQTARYVLVANYDGGSVAMLPILGDGRLGPASCVIQHTGSSVNPQRQREAHAHSITVDPTSRYAIVADLGMDQVLVYRLDLEGGRLIPNDPPGVRVEPGAGPRHFAFHPDGRYGYLINELGSTMTAFAYDSSRGTLQPLQTLSTLPADFQGTNYCADVHVHPSGRFVYGSNRGHDSIVVYRIDESTGRLSLIGHTATGGRTPRNFALEPSGRFLFAANQNSDTIVTFRIDSTTGQLTPTGQITEVPTPVCVQVIPFG